jgi:BolA protein
MNREERIKQILLEKFKPIKFSLQNESHTHNVPQGSETHFKLEMVSSSFEGLSRVARQQLVMSALKEEFEAGLHAFTMRLKAVSELKPSEQKERFESPPCMGGMKPRD